MTDPLPEIDVVVVTFNPGDVLAPTLRSVQASEGVIPHITVVDNASADGCLGTAAQMGATCVALDRNVGYGAGFNEGMHSTHSDWVACANQDLRLAPQTVSTLISAVASYETRTGVPCIAGPRLLAPDGELVETCHEIPSLWRQIVALLAGDGAAGYRNAHPAGDSTRRCGWVSAAFILGRRSTFEAVGGFDAAYFMYAEDLDLFTRLAEAGFHCLWVPEASAVHLGGPSKVPTPEAYAHCLLNLGRYFTQRDGRLAGATVLASAVAGTLARAGLWWARSRNRNALARARARSFAKASLIAALSALIGGRKTPRTAVVIEPHRLRSRVAQRTLQEPEPTSIDCGPSSADNA